MKCLQTFSWKYTNAMPTATLLNVNVCRWGGNLLVLEYWTNEAPAQPGYISDQPFNMLRILRNTCQNWGKSPVPPRNCKCSMHGYPAKVFLHWELEEQWFLKHCIKTLPLFHMYSLYHILVFPRKCTCFDAWSKWAWLIIIITVIGFFFFFTKFLYFHGSVHVLMHEVNEPD